MTPPQFRCLEAEREIPALWLGFWGSNDTSSRGWCVEAYRFRNPMDSKSGFHSLVANSLPVRA